MGNLVEVTLEIGAELKEQAERGGGGNGLTLGAGLMRACIHF